MHAIILAAGVGRRLGRFTDQHPKCLLSFANLTLIERHLLHLQALGIQQVTIVTGHHAEQIRAQVMLRPWRAQIHFIFNPDYRTGSARSLLQAAPVLGSGPCIFMDADILCGPELFQRLMDHPSPDCLLVDTRLVDSGEEVKIVATPDGPVRELGKQIEDSAHVLGESIGMFKLSFGTARRLILALTAAVAVNPSIEYEPVLNGLLPEIVMQHAAVSDLPWTEIDFPPDVEKARTQVLPLLKPISRSDPLLFTPGPLTTSAGVKAAMLHDVGSRHETFVDAVRRVREELLQVAGVFQAGYEAILVQGSGTYAVESVLSTLTPPQGRWLFLVNGAYGRRMVKIASILGLAHDAIEWEEDQPIDPAQVQRRLSEDETLSHLAIVHCETTTGLLNPIEAVGKVVQKAGRRYLVDAMSSFGGIEMSLPEAGIDWLVSSSNKCLSGVPGLGIVLARRSTLEAGWARSLSLDLIDQWRGLELDGQFRFTPPTHALLALDQALEELRQEGGIAARANRYVQNQHRLVAGMAGLGFRCMLRPADQSPIITTFLPPATPTFSFQAFYEGLQRRGCVIYPGKLSQRESFRIGTIGDIYTDDIDRLLDAVAAVLLEMGISGRA